MFDYVWFGCGIAAALIFVYFWRQDHKGRTPEHPIESHGIMAILLCIVVICGIVGLFLMLALLVQDIQEEWHAAVERCRDKT